MVTRKRQRYVRLIKFHANRIELITQLVRRVAVDLSCDGCDGVVVRRYVIGIQFW
jgi:hypothetical protein